MNDRGTCIKPWIAFQEDWDTGMSIRRGRFCFLLDGVAVPFDEWCAGLAKKGQISAMEALLLPKIVPSKLLWEPGGGWEALEDKYK